MMRGWERWGWLIHIRVWAWVLSHSFFLLFVVLSFGLSCPVSFLSEQSIIAVVSFSLLIIFFLSMVPLTRSYWGIESVVSVM